MKGKSKSRQIEEKILSIAIDLARKGEGALFVIGEKIKYEKLLKQKMEFFNIFDTGAAKILRSIATIDGAVIINKKGDIVEYGAMIKGARAFPGYGTRHAAALAASHNGNTAIVCSEEERKVKIFKRGKFIMQLDALQKNIEKEIPKVTSFLESLGAGFLGAIGATALVPALGIVFLPGVIVVGASYYAIKKILNRMN